MRARLGKGDLPMSNVRVVKLIESGASQAVCLPDDFRFEGTEVYAMRDEATGSVTLYSRSNARRWDEFFELIDQVDQKELDDFMKDRPLNTPPPDRDIFGDVE